MENKIKAYKRKNEHSDWYAVIECGKWDMLPASSEFFKNKETGIVYRFYKPILNPPDSLKQWDEISVSDVQAVSLEQEPQARFEGWEECENNSIKLLYKLAEFAEIEKNKVKEFIDSIKE